MKRVLIKALALVFSFILALSCCVIGFAEEETNMTAEKADSWNQLFDRSGKTNSWLCADGIYSVSLDGRDAIGSATDKTKSFFIFSDTFIGNADTNGVMNSQGMVNHSAMLLEGDQPLDASAEFIWGLRGDTSKKNNMFGADLWMFDLLCDGKNLYLFGFTHDNQWKPGRIDMYTVPVTEDGVDLTAFKRKPLVSQLLKKTEKKHYVFSMGIMPNTKTAGVKNPDGYYYFYGYRDNIDYAFFQTKDLIVSRIHEKDFPDFSKLTYWNGSEWGTNIEESAVIVENVSCEVSVTPIDYGPNAGKYIAVYTEAVQSSHMRYALGETPWGPFSESVEFYTAPETQTTALGNNGTLYTYNAKAHPHLSDSNRLLISYNVNVSGSAALNCKDYHPRFLYLDLGGEVPEVMPEDTTTDTVVGSTSAPIVDTPVTDTPTSSSDTLTPEPAVPKQSPALPIALSVGAALLLGGGIGLLWYFKKKRK